MLAVLEVLVVLFIFVLDQSSCILWPMSGDDESVMGVSTQLRCLSALADPKGLGHVSSLQFFAIYIFVLYSLPSSVPSSNSMF